MKHNDRIKKLVDRLESKVYASQTHKELEDALEFFKYYNGKFEYKNKLSYLFGITALIISLYFAFQLYIHGNNNSSIAEWSLIVLVSGLTSFFTLKKQLDKDYEFYNLERLIVEKDFLYDNDLKNIAITDNIFNSLKLRFPQEYNRGDYSNYFEGSYRTIDENKYGLKFDIIKYTYVNEIKSKNGTSYNHYNRYSVITSFDYYKSIEMRSENMSHIEYNKVNYKTGSFNFDNEFKLGAKDKNDIIKFLKPTIIESAINLNKNFRSLNIEVDNRGLMCISTKDPIVTSVLYLDMSQDFRDFIKESYEDFDLKRILSSVLYLWKNSSKREYVEFLFNHFLNNNRMVSLKNPRTMYQHVTRGNNSYNIKLIADFINTMHTHSDKNF